MRDIENCKKVIEIIESQPNSWDQKNWHSECGTKHCVAGWAQILANKEVSNMYARRDARIFLKLTVKEANYFFDMHRTLEEIKVLADPNITDLTSILPCKPPKYNEEGYDSEGFDRCGYNKEGFNRYGFDYEGYDKKGFNENGYNREGYNRTGYDIDGLDKNFNSTIQNDV